MNNIPKNLTKYFISSALLILAFGPTFGFGMFAGPPAYSDETGSAENQEKDGSADKTGPADQSSKENPGPQRFADQGMQGKPDGNENSSRGY
jgi:hypothetical protein